MMEWMFPSNGPLKCENTMENDVLKLWRFQKLLTTANIFECLSSARQCSKDL